LKETAKRHEIKTENNNCKPQKLGGKKTQKTTKLKRITAKIG